MQVVIAEYRRRLAERDTHLHTQGRELPATHFPRITVLLNATAQHDFFPQMLDTMARFSAWLYDILIGFVRSLTNGQRALLIAEIGFASVGAYSSYLYYAPTRGMLFGTVAAVSIVLLYIGGAGAAVKYPWQQYLAWGLVLIGTLSEIFCGVMIGLREALPGLFNPTRRCPQAASGPYSARRRSLRAHCLHSAHC